jgi:hypothetical protein
VDFLENYILLSIKHNYFVGLNYAAN